MVALADLLVSCSAMHASAPNFGTGNVVLHAAGVATTSLSADSNFARQLHFQQPVAALVALLERFDLEVSSLSCLAFLHPALKA